jgi:thiol-disulfide isomerase/thioredoxin
MKALFLLIIISLQARAGEVPNYQVRVGLDPASKIPRWLVEMVPPSGHHFNLSAPMRVESHEKAIGFNSILKSATRLGFSASTLALTEKDHLSTSAFLCDQAKTYCVKKSLEVPLTVDPALQFIGSKNDTPASEPKPKSKALKDAHGFWIQDYGRAIAEAQKSGKPLLIDFYGIWCPPCNLYSETVFPRDGFRKLAKRFVLLKMDSDEESSYELKSHFQVGGYPSLVIASAPKENSISALREVGRIVGFFPESELVQQLTGFLKVQSMSLDERIKDQKTPFYEKLPKDSAFYKHYMCILQ